MTVPAALGANLWMVAVAVPLLLGHGGQAASWRGIGALVALALLAPTLLIAGLWRRSPGALLIAFPVAAMLPQALLATSDAAFMASPPWLLSGASLLGYVVAATWALRQKDVGAGKPLDGKKALSRDTVPSRWRRRLRIYRQLTFIAALFPLVLLLHVENGPIPRLLEQGFGARAARAQTLLTVLVGLLWMVLYRAYFLQPLYGHLQQDREVQAASEAARKLARLGRPRPAFYVFVVMALLAMVAVVVQRAHWAPDAGGVGAERRE